MSQRDNLERKDNNAESKDELYKIKAYKGLTILENVKEYLPQDISRNDIKGMVYNALGDTIVNDKSNYIKGKNLTSDQVEGIVDMLMNIVSKNENSEESKFDDERLNDVKLKIGFYDGNKENVRKFMFRGKNPSDQDVENTYNQLSSNGTENVKFLAIEFQD